MSQTENIYNTTLDILKTTQQTMNILFAVFLIMLMIDLRTLVDASLDS